jgi:hypothetical protein
MSQLAIALLPLLGLVLALVAGRYPGERVLAGWRSRRSRAWPSNVGGAPTPPCEAYRRLCGGLLIASALAGRGPPRVASC